MEQKKTGRPIEESRRYALTNPEIKSEPESNDRHPFIALTASVLTFTISRLLDIGQLLSVAGALVVFAFVLALKWVWK